MSKNHDNGPQLIMTPAKMAPLPVAALQAVGSNVVQASQQMAAQVKPKTRCVYFYMVYLIDVLGTHMGK